MADDSRITSWTLNQTWKREPSLLPKQDRLKGLEKDKDYIDDMDAAANTLATYMIRDSKAIIEDKHPSKVDPRKTGSIFGDDEWIKLADKLKPTTTKTWDGSGGVKRLLFPFQSYNWILYDALQANKERMADSVRKGIFMACVKRLIKCIFVAVLKRVVTRPSGGHWGFQTDAALPSNFYTVARAFEYGSSDARLPRRLDMEYDPNDDLDVNYMSSGLESGAEPYVPRGGVASRRAHARLAWLHA